jgi:hypothetical protein
VELFKITCVTCRARLSVRDAALVGQILACPRCGMMVQVAQPADDQANGSGPADVAGVNDLATSAIDAASPAQGTPAGEASTKAESATAPVTAFDDAAAMATAESVAAPAAEPAVARPTASAWARYRFGVLILTSAVAGSALVAAVLTWSTGGDDGKLASAAPASVAQDNPVAAPIERPAAAPKPGDDNNPHTEQQPDSASSGIPEPTTPAEAEAATSSPTEIAADVNENIPSDAKPSEPPAVTAPSESAPTDEASDAAPPQDAAEAATVETAAHEAPSARRLRIDPLDIDPEGLDLTTLYAGPMRDPLANSQLPKEEPRAASVPSEPRPDADDAAEAARLAALRPVRRDADAELEAPAVPTVLARRLPAVSFDQMPLCRLLDLSVQMSGLPISVAPAELRMAGISAATPVSVDATDATIEDLLSAALKPLRLKPVFTEDQLVLKRIAEDKRRTVDYAVDDLGEDPAEVEQLAAWIQQLVAPNHWQSSGGDATLAIEDRQLKVTALESVQYEVLLMLERYRLTRDLPMRSKYPKSLLAAGDAYTALAERVSGPVTFTFSDYTPLREIFRYWQEELQIAVLVDWPALVDERLSPQTRIACSATDKPWADAMDAVLHPLGLGWRAADRRTIELTSAVKASVEPQLELYRLGAEAALTPEQLDAKLSELGAAADGAASGNSSVYDAQHRVLLVRYPAAVQRLLAAWLDKQKLLARDK